MRKILFCTTAFSLIFASACKNDSMNNKDIKPPVAIKIPTEIETHGDIRIDNYFWMRLSDEQKNAKIKDEQTTKVLDFLNAENDYYNQITAHTNDFQSSLFEEMKSRIKEDDESVPYKKNGYFYITKYEKGQQYPIYTRKKESLDAEEALLFNVNELAEGHDYFQLGGLNVSPNNELVAFSVDTISRRQYVLHIKNLKTGKVYDDVITNTNGGSVWANDNKTLFYTKKDPVSLRSYKIYKHVLGTSESDDVEVFHESDDTFGTFVTKSKSNKYIIIGSYSTVSSEYQFLDADTPNGTFQTIQKRERNLEYDIAHYNDHFYIRTNKDGAINFKLMKTPVTKTSKEN